MDNGPTVDELGRLARTGRSSFSWTALLHLLESRIAHVLSCDSQIQTWFSVDNEAADDHDSVNNPKKNNSHSVCNDMEQLRDIIILQLREFQISPPFTLQRLCELLYEPNKEHKSLIKYARAIEKMLMVTTVVDLNPPETDSLSANHSPSNPLKVSSSSSSSSSSTLSADMEIENNGLVETVALETEKVAEEHVGEKYAEAVNILSREAAAAAEEEMQAEDPAVSIAESQSSEIEMNA